MMRFFHSIAFYTLLFVATIVLGIVAIIMTFTTRNDNHAHLVARVWGRLLLRAAGVKATVHGLENIDPGRSCIYAANHQGAFDIFAVLANLPVQFRWLAKEELFHLFVLGRAMKAAGYIPIDRSDRKKAFTSINLAAERVRNGTSVFIFPEGTRSLDGVLMGFKKGGFILAIKSQQPIVPISISGSYRVLPKKHGWMIHPGTIQMTIGVPISTEGRTARDRDALMAAVGQAIRRNLTPHEAGNRECAAG